MKMGHKAMNKLNYSITMYPDEDHRSILYRLHRMSNRNQRVTKTNKMLIGKHVSVLTLLPVNMAVIINKLMSNTPPDYFDFLSKHTYLPLVIPFLKHDQSSALMDFISGISTKGIIASKYTSFISKEIRYCTECLKSDYESGECFVHRIHQINKLEYCHKHKTRLITKCPICEAPLVTGQRLLYNPSCINCGMNLFSPEVNIPIEVLNFLNSIQYLLSNGLSLKREDILYRYDCYEYMNLNNNVQQRGLFIEKLISRMSTIGVSINNDSHFVSRYLNLIYSGDLLVHLGFMAEFAGGAQNFFERQPPLLFEPIPFGNGPWKCRNEYCKAYKDGVEILTKIKRRYSRQNKRMEAVFACPECDFVYSLSVDNDTYKVLNYGSVWKQGYLNDPEKFQSIGKVNYYKRTIRKKGEIRIEKQLHSIYWFDMMIKTYYSNLNYNETSRIMNTNADTVKKYVSLYEKHQSLEIFYTIRTCEGFEEYSLNQVKKSILEVLQTNENVSRTELKKNWITQNEAIIGI